MSELKCLADNVYYEARGEPYKGKVLVAKTTLNRVKHPHFPSDICGVVYQPYQFSWTLSKQKDPDPEQWNIAVKAAYDALESNSKALYFHAASVRPEWAETKKFLYQVGNHLFYK